MTTIWKIDACGDYEYLTLTSTCDGRLLLKPFFDSEEWPYMEFDEVGVDAIMNSLQEWKELVRANN